MADDVLTPEQFADKVWRQVEERRAAASASPAPVVAPPAAPAPVADAPYDLSSDRDPTRAELARMTLAQSLIVEEQRPGLSARLAAADRFAAEEAKAVVREATARHEAAKEEAYRTDPVYRERYHRNEAGKRLANEFWAKLSDREKVVLAAEAGEFAKPNLDDRQRDYLDRLQARVKPVSGYQAQGTATGSTFSIPGKDGVFQIAAA